MLMKTRVTYTARLGEVIRSERGVSLLIVLMATLLMSALGLGLVLSTSTETMISSNFSNTEEALYAADAGIERVMDDLLTVPDWNTILAGSTRSAFVDGPPSGGRTLADGTTVNLTEATNMANCGKLTTCSDTDMDTNSDDRPWGENNPRWQLYAYGPLNNIVPTGTVNSNTYVIVWVGDDQSENDNDPTIDGNDQTNPGMGVLALHAEAFGPRGTHKFIEVTVARTNSNEIERGYVGQRGQDEQNRRARKAAVQTPGKALTKQSLGLQTGTLN
jgi:type IV pilus assembly PilX-like protein